VKKFAQKTEYCKDQCHVESGKPHKHGKSGHVHTHPARTHTPRRGHA